MYVNKSELNLACDVDNTLIMRDGGDSGASILIFCPYTKKAIYVWPHHDQIDLLKSQYARGYCITVWSHAGWQWAKAVVEALGLESIVYEVRTKNIKFIDDEDASTVLGPRVYLPYKG